MKKQLLIKTSLLLVALVGGVSVSWADAVSIPQDLGSYVNWETQATKTAGNGSPQSDKTQLGSTSGSTTYTVSLNNSIAQNYIMQFASGANGLTAKVSFTLTDGSSYNVTKEFDVSNTGAWTPTEMHYAEFESVPTGTLTLTFKVESTTGSYAGNYGMLSFNTGSQYAQWPVSPTYLLDVTKGSLSTSGVCRYSEGTTDISYVKNGGVMDDFVVYNETANYYKYSMYVNRNNQTTWQIKVTVTDLFTGKVEAQQTFDNPTSTGTHLYPIASQISQGLKKIRFDIIAPTEDYLNNLSQMTFVTYDPVEEYGLLPVMSSSTTYLNLSTWPTSGNPRYESGNQNLGYIYHGNTAYFYVNNTNESAYYNICAGISTNVSDANLKVTVTDLATNTNEVSETFDVPVSSNFATQTFKLSAPISAGIKKITFDFTKDDETTSNWLYNIKNITFYKRSLNEGYDYTPVAATDVDVVLTRSITAGNWSTIVLPFALTSEQITSAFGTNVEVAALTNKSTADVLNFNTVTAMTANQPYAIKVKDGEYTSPKTISGVTIEEPAATPTQSLTSWDFVGTYTSGNIPLDSYFFNSNKLFKAASESNTIKPFRAYFTPKGGAGARELKFIIDGDDTTSIGTIKADGTMETTAEGTVYNLSGQRVNKPAKGLYVINGKKVIIK
ncbi:MAG: hypothetical protein IKN02_00990 [Prevotella sp.]|nr:hypothetical protein [Prevotella sp.]